MAVYPYDNYTSQIAYLAAIQGIMNGTRKLPTLSIPQPWTSATYVQFTGRAPASLVPGYAKEATWAQTVDLNIQIEALQLPPSPIYPAYQAASVLNVRKTPSMSGEWLGYLWVGTIIHVDTNDTSSGYSHFQPIPAFPVGGWVYSSYLKKA